MIVHDISQNHILAALPAKDRARIVQDLELVNLPLGKTVFNSGLDLRHVYFPTTAIVSLLFEIEDGSSHEVAMVGNEGVVGVSLFMGGEHTVNRAVVQSPGYAYKLSGKLLKSEFHRGSFVQHLLLRYTFALLTEIAQTLVCNCHHSMDQQFCRWLLLRFDRLPSNSLAITQEQIANLLGMRRNAISEITVSLQAAGLIKLGRGHIALIDRPGLEARVCECYAVIRERLEQTSEPSSQAA